MPVIKFGMWGKTEQVQTTGAQLFDVFSLRSKTMNGITFDILQDGGVHVYGTATAQAYMSPVEFHLPPGMYFASSKNANKKISFFVSTAPKDSNAWKEHSERVITVLETEKVRAYLNVMSGLTVDEVVYPMLNKGDISLPWEPYSGGFTSPSPEWEQPIEVTNRSITVTIKGETEQQSITLVPPKPLTKWDKLEKIDGVWKWVYQSDNAIYDGSENWIGYSEENRKGVFELRVNSAKRKESADIFCSRYKGVYKPIDRLQDNEITLYYSRLDNNPNDNWIDLKNTTYSDVSEFKNSLFENPLTVYYETTTPEYIPLSQLEQNKLNTLTMYTPTTEITNDGGCTMELTYTVDTKSYVDSKIAEISKAII